MSNDDTLTVVDLFAGAGGLSTGVVQAIIDMRRETIAHETGLDPAAVTTDNRRVHWWLGENVDLHAVNHWDPAIETHEQNHPWVNHYNAKIEELHPPDVVEPGTVDLLCGGPSCTHYSTARGGKPVKEQKRASAWVVLKWIELLQQPEQLLIENVKEFRDWGPIKDGQPSRDGTIFQRWVGCLRSMDYDVLYDPEDEDYGVVLNAADYGEAQSRERLFLMASQSSRPTPPAQSHSDDDSDKPDRRTAADIIDWSDLGTSIWTRDLEHPRVQPLSNTTMGRIAEGIRRHCDDRLGAFADALESLGADELEALRERVIPAKHAPRVAQLVDEPFLVRYEGIKGDAESIILRQQSGGVPATVDAPLPTVSKAGAIGMASADLQTLVQPRNGPRRGDHSNPLYPAAERPMHTVTAQNHDGHILTPTLLHYSHGGRLRDIGAPMATIATEKGGAFALTAPYLTPMYNGRAGQRPRTRSPDRPLMTIPASKSPSGLSTPFLVDYHGKSDPQPLNEPLGTIETKERFALVVPECWPWGLDVRYRMLQPRELKQAQGFPAHYELAGDTKSDITEQIGNAVPVSLARALVRHLLADETPSLSNYGGGIQPDPDAEVPDYEEVLASDD